MPRPRKVYAKRKGGPGRKKIAPIDTEDSVNNSETSVQFVKDTNYGDNGESGDRLCSPSVNICSASKRKLSSADTSVNSVNESVCEDYNDSTGKTSLNGNIIIDIELLSAAVCSFMKCKFCDACDSIVCFEDIAARKGLTCRLFFQCMECHQKFAFYSSKTTESGHYENNLRFVYALRSIGKGESAGRTLCMVMNLPKGPTRYQRYTSCINEAVRECAEISMRSAVLEAVENNEGCKDIAVAIDGSWHRRGHTSLHGVVSATSVDSGKVIDIEVLTKYCHKCCVEKNKDKLKEHQESDECKINYKGSSGGMEVAGAKTIFSRSLDTYGVRYVKYLGDGDSKGFLSVVESKPYGETTVEKLECIGHIQKRMGTRLRKLREKLRGEKLEDGRGIGGRGRLTDKEIDRLQSYYGQAIRSNTECVKKMKTAIWAIYFHKLSTDSNPYHMLCPKGITSWCKFNRALETGEKYSHQNSLPSAICDQIKPIFRSLADPNLLQKCLHGQTQNPNESFNNMIWNKIPKTVFVGYETLLIGVYDAVLSFNDGNVGKLNVLKKLGLEPGVNMVRCCSEIDTIRVKKAERELEIIKKRSRQHARQIKRARQDAEKDNDPDYGPGMF